MPGSGCMVNVDVLGMRGRERFVRYVVRLRSVMEIVRAMQIECEVGYRKPYKQGGGARTMPCRAFACVAGRVELPRRGVKQESQGEWRNEKTLASSNPFDETR